MAFSVVTSPKTRPLQSLIIRQSGEDTEDDRGPAFQLDFHESVSYGVTDVFEVHS